MRSKGFLRRIVWISSGSSKGLSHAKSNSELAKELLRMPRLIVQVFSLSGQGLVRILGQFYVKHSVALQDVSQNDSGSSCGLVGLRRRHDLLYHASSRQPEQTPTIELRHALGTQAITDGHFDVLFQRSSFFSFSNFS